jgi:hypothetical protein
LSRRASIALVISAVTMVIAASMAVGLRWAHPLWHAEDYLPAIEKAATPTILAIEEYTRRKGHPPDSLRDLLPEYDAWSASTGYPRQSQFEYFVYRTHGEKTPSDAWALVLFTDLFALESDAIRYDSRNRSWNFD